VRPPQNRTVPRWTRETCLGACVSPPEGAASDRESPNQPNAPARTAGSQLTTALPVGAPERRPPGQTAQLPRYEGTPASRRRSLRQPARSLNSPANGRYPNARILYRFLRLTPCGIEGQRPVGRPLLDAFHDTGDESAPPDALAGRAGDCCVGKRDSIQTGAAPWRDPAQGSRPVSDRRRSRVPPIPR
jgi:hypothetical protein